MENKFQVLHDGQGQEEANLECEHLDSIRASFTDCCVYPNVKFRQFEAECAKSCEEAKEEDWCCEFVCEFNTLGLLSRNKAGKPVVGDVHWQGIISALMSSVKNDTKWAPIVNEVVKKCNEQFGGSTDARACKVVPTTIFDVIGCSNIQHILKCPTWNPNGIENCKYTLEYATKCF